MKLGPITKLGKISNVTSKKINDDFIQQIVTYLSFFEFTANLEQSGSRIPDEWSVKSHFINSNILSYKNWKQNQKICNTTVILSIFFPKNADFL